MRPRNQRAYRARRLESTRKSRASAIAASFNTPLAGVAFALEVVLMEFTVGNLTPVILAAVSGATVGRLFYGSSTAFLVPPLYLESLWELPYVVAMGVVIGAMAAAFIVLVRELTRATGHRPWWLRMLAASVLIGGCGVVVPVVSRGTPPRSVFTSCSAWAR